MRVMLIREALRAKFGDYLQVINLGAGYDTTYYWAMHQHPFKRLNWIEIDFPEVMCYKKEKAPCDEHVNGCEIRFVGLDLCSINDDVLKDIIDPDLPTVFISECVLSYIDKGSANRILEWCAKTALIKADRYLILYEQLLSPKQCVEGSDKTIIDGFTTTMLRHFEGLSCPLKSSIPYSTMDSQMNRFKILGWSAQIWSSSEACREFLPFEMIDVIDGRGIADFFDEEEEFAIKKGHYFLCTATVGKENFHSNVTLKPQWSLIQSKDVVLESRNLWAHCSAACSAGILVYGGYGTVSSSSSRKNDLLLIKDTETILIESDCIPGSLMFSSMHLIKNGDQKVELLLFGGRGKPDDVRGAVWKLELNVSEKACSWNLLCNEPLKLPTRHQSVLYENSLIVFAKDSLLCFDLLCCKWTSLHLCAELRMALEFPFTATLWNEHIYLIGRHNLKLDPKRFKVVEVLKIKYKSLDQEFDLPAFAYHQCLAIDTVCFKGLILIGGLSTDLEHRNLTIRPEFTLIYIDIIYHTWQPIKTSVHSLIKHTCHLMPHTDAGFKIRSIGGGFICFSMGSYYSPDYEIVVDSTIPIISRLDSLSEPAILRGMDVGVCTSVWSKEYLKNAISGDTLVSCHVSPSRDLSFCPRNFEFQVMPWPEMLENLQSHNIYFRAIGANPRKQVADFETSFPGLVADVKYPEWLKKEKIFSSILRMSSPGISLWTHYDVMDNVLMQIVGSKEVVLWHPYEVKNLEIEGSSSRIVDLEDPRLRRTMPRRLVLEPGDALFIPALWFHRVRTMDDSWASVALNVFWKELDASLYAKKDLYGNADLVPFTESHKLLSVLPEPFRTFYARKL